MRLWWVLSILAVVGSGCGDSGGNASDGPPAGSDGPASDGAPADASGADAAPTVDARAVDGAVDAPTVEGGSSPDGGGSSDGGPSSNPYPNCPDCQHVQYVISSATTPTSNAEATALGCDVDGNGTVDNQLGKVLVAFRNVSSSIDPQMAIDRGFMQGKIILLSDVEYRPSLSDPTVTGMRTFVGTHDPSDGLSAPEFYQGNGRFFPMPPGGAFGGQIMGGNGLYGPGTLPVTLPFFVGNPTAINLVDARVLGQFAPQTIMGGKICGAIPATTLVNMVFPALADGISAAVKLGGATAATLRGLFDTDGSCGTDPDCTPDSPSVCHCISASEVGGNSIVRSLLSPDLDLDPNATNPFVTDPSDPAYPNDALSFGFGFVAHHAQFTLP
jgi:hypothetical protein